MNRQSLAVGIVFVLCLCAAVQANPLNLTVPHDPWVLTDAVYVQYTLTGADTGHLLAYGCPTTYNDGPESTVTLNPYYSYFELNLDLYTSGEPIGGMGRAHRHLDDELSALERRLDLVDLQRREHVVEAAPLRDPAEQADDAVQRRQQDDHEAPQGDASRVWAETRRHKPRLVGGDVLEHGGLGQGQ